MPSRARTCVVVGGGLAGLAAAYSLVRRGWAVNVLEAQPRLGVAVAVAVAVVAAVGSRSWPRLALRGTGRCGRPASTTQLEGTMRSSFLAAAGALTIQLTASVANADEAPDAARAAALFAEGRQLLAGGDYTAACPKLAESQALAPAPDTAFDLGLCYEKASQAAFKAARDLARSPDTGSAAGPAPALALAPGPEAPSPGQTQRAVGLVMGGAGLVGVVTAVVTGVMAKSAWDDATSACPSGVCPAAMASRISTAHDLALASSISLVTGGVALGAGAIVFFTAPKSRAGTGAAVGVGPATGGTGLAVVGRF